MPSGLLGDVPRNANFQGSMMMRYRHRLVGVCFVCWMSKWLVDVRPKMGMEKKMCPLLRLGGNSQCGVEMFMAGKGLRRPYQKRTNDFHKP